MIKDYRIIRKNIIGQKLDEAQVKGELSKAADVAKELLKLKMKNVDIAKITGLTMNQVKAIANDITNVD